MRRRDTVLTNAKVFPARDTRIIERGAVWISGNRIR